MEFTLLERGCIMSTFRKALVVTCAAMMCLLATFTITGCSGSAQDNASDQSGTAALGETRIFTDSLGREVEVPVNIERIAPSGHTSNQILLTFAPELMVGLSQEMSADEAKYLGQDYADLPVFGAIFGSKGDLNKEALAAADPQVIIDTGEPLKDIAEDLDNLQNQLGIPVVYIQTSLDSYDEAYALLGDLLNMPERGEALSDYCAKAYEETSSVMASIPESERVNAAYLTGDAGLNAYAKGSVQSTVIDMCTNNVVIVENATGSGIGSEVSLEQISLWDPEFIIFGKNSIYDEVSADPTWSQITAVKNGDFYEVPSAPYVWLNNPPTVNQILGLQWLPRICYPQAYDNDLQQVVTEYYELFYGYELSQAEYDELIAKAS